MIKVFILLKAIKKKCHNKQMLHWAKTLSIWTTFSFLKTQNSLIRSRKKNPSIKLANILEMHLPSETCLLKGEQGNIIVWLKNPLNKDDWKAFLYFLNHFSSSWVLANLGSIKADCWLFNHFMTQGCSKHIFCVQSLYLFIYSLTQKMLFSDFSMFQSLCWTLKRLWWAKLMFF